MRHPEGELSSEFLNRWAPNVFYVPLPLNTHSQAWWIWYTFWSINLTDWKGKGFFFNAMRVFSALQMITFLVHPVLPLNKEIMFRYKGCDWQSGREVPFLVTKARQSWTIFLHQPPTTCARCKETPGRNLSNLLNLKTPARNYSQPIHLSSAFVL